MITNILNGKIKSSFFFQGFDELLDLATQGDFRQVDMLVKDIYGDRESEYASLGLSPTIIASSFGKAINYDSRYIFIQQY